MSLKKCKDLILGAVTLVLGVLYTIFAYQIKTRPKLTPSYGSARVVPILLGFLLIFLSILLIIQGIRKMKHYDPAEDTAKMSRGDMLAVVLTVAVIILYTLMLPILGFCFSTIVFLFLCMIVLAPKEKRNYLLFAIVAVVFTAIVFVAFRIGLKQVLPRGFIEALLGF